MTFDISRDGERPEKWPPERIERELFELEFARETCVPAEER